MGFAAVFRATFLSVAALVVLFAITVALSDTVRGFYEDQVEPWLEASEFFFTWLGSIYNILPMIVFITIEDWAEVFFDCFTPISMWLEILYSTVFLVLSLVFVGDLERNYARIMMEFCGMGIQLVAIIGYVFQKLAYDAQYSQNEANRQFRWALYFFKACGFFILVQIQFKLISPEGQGYWRIALWLALFGILLQWLQIAFSIGYRIHEDNFKNDPTNIGRVKLAAALIKVVTMSYDSWIFYARGYWQSPEKRMIAIMTAGSLFFVCSVALGRDVGPENLKKAYLTLSSGVRAAYRSSVDGIGELWNAVGAAFHSCVDGVEELWNVVRAAFHSCVDGIEELWNTERPGVNNLMVVVCIALCCGLLQSL